MEADQRSATVPEPSGQWRISDLKGSKLVAVQAGGVLTFVVSLVLGLIIRGVYQGTGEGSVTISGFSDLLFLLVGVVAVLVLHEAVHGILFGVFGGRARFGAKLLGRVMPVLYATSDVRLPRNRYLVVCLGPFAILTLGLLLAGVLVRGDGTAMLALLLMAVNAGGSVGDMVLSHKLRMHSPSTLFQDSEDGFLWWSSHADE